MRLLALTAVFALVSFASAQDRKTPARALDLKNVKFKHDGNMPVAAIAESAEALEKIKAIADEASRDAIKKQVDFAKEKVVVFAWSGSGGDKLVPGTSPTAARLSVIFTYTAGATDDVKQHAFVFAVPKGAMIDVKK